MTSAGTQERRLERPRLALAGELSSDVGSVTRQFFMILSLVDGVEREERHLSFSRAARRRMLRLHGDPNSSEGVLSMKGSCEWALFPTRIKEWTLEDCQHQIKRIVRGTHSTSLPALVNGRSGVRGPPESLPRESSFITAVIISESRKVSKCQAHKRKHRKVN